MLSLCIVPGRDEKTAPALCANAHGFSLHAAVCCGAHQRKELERLCRYITRPAIANERQLWRKSTVSNGSRAPSQNVRERTLESTTVEFNDYWPSVAALAEEWTAAAAHLCVGISAVGDGQRV